MSDTLKVTAIVIRSIAIALVAWNLIAAESTMAQKSNDPEQRTVLAIFAHPDDEFMVAPILSKFARQGYRVHLAIASDGRYGVTEHAGITAGDSLAAVRADEIKCSAETLQIDPPSLFGLKDGFAHKEPELGKVLSDFEQIHSRVQELIEKLQPDVILTWSPGGGYGHPDHRAVSDVVTEVVQKGNTGDFGTLLYTGISSQKIESLPEFSRPVIQWFASTWNTTDQDFLTVEVTYTESDLQRAREALGCHRSQFIDADMDELIRLLEHVYDGKLTLRPWDGDADKAMRLLR